jgi:hypothetical protein
VLAAGLLLSSAGTGPARADATERELLRQAPNVLAFLTEHGYKNVGVLKFRVKKGAAAAGDNVGPLNANLANRLEVALVLCNRSEQLGIIHDASAVAAGLRGASHLTKEGREVLFSGRYPLAWGGQKVGADAFLTGVVKVSPNLRDLNVFVLAFDRETDGLKKVCEFTVPMDPATLIETGESFKVRGLFDRPDKEKPEQKQEKAIQAAAKVKDRQEKYPLEDDGSPLDLQICYDGKPVRYELKDNKALIPEPREGQEVTFLLRRKGPAREPLGVVLKVNGENTLFHEKLKDVDCHKWILAPGDGPLVIRGFHSDDRSAVKFRVSSPEESKKNEVNYGADVGTISVTVFRERKGKEPPPSLDEDAEDEAATNRGIFPGQTPRTLSALQSQLRAEARVTRGLIEKGEAIAASLKRVSFKADETPIMSATITYYRPKS